MGVMGMSCKHVSNSGASAITVCQRCRDYLCSICGGTIVWHDDLRVSNPGAQWRYCEKPACVEAEAAYHGFSVTEMTQYRAALRVKRMQKPKPVPHTATQLPSGAVHIKLAPQPFKLDPGEACWCNRGKDCDGSHEVWIGAPVNRCGICGKTFEIRSDDPHWSTGRGPICPDDTRLS